MSSGDSSTDDRVDRIEARLDRLERAVREIRSALDADDVEPEGTELDREGDASREGPGEGGPAERGPSSAQGGTPAESNSTPPRPDSTETTDAARTPATPDASSSGPSGASGQEAWAEWIPIPLRSEDWVNYVGVGLLLFGLALLFQYSVQQGWLVPSVRVGFGGVVGSVLLGAGLRIYNQRQRLRQVLLGGSSATFYGTIFAAYQLYGLVSYPVAFGSMAAVTGMSIGLALREDHASMAVIGTVGGLGTPFLLYSDVGAVGGFAVYTCLVLASACAIYVYRGWRSLLYAAVGGGWIVLLVPCADAAFTGRRPPGAGLLQAGLTAAWLLLGGTPVLRAVLRAWQPERWPQPDPVGSGGLAVRGLLYGPVSAAPFVFLLATRLLWTGSGGLWASLAAVGTLVYGGAYVGLRRVPLPRAATIHGLVAAVLATYAVSEVFGGSTLLLTWAVEGLLLFVVARRLGEPALRGVGHVLFGIVACGLGIRFTTPAAEAHPLLSPPALSELAALGAGAAAVRWVQSPSVRRLYRGVLIGGWLGWWAHGLLPVPHGPAYLLLVGGASAVGLLEWARRGGDAIFRYAGHATFAMLAAGIAARWVGAFGAGATVLVGIAPLSEMVVGGLALVVSRRVGHWRARGLYQGGVLVGWLGWWGHELLSVPNGQAYVSLVWGLTTAGLLVYGAWHRQARMQKAGLGTLALFVGKLFLVDLAALPAPWRIVLFIGAGGGFLLISYALPGLGTLSGAESGS